MSERTLWLEVRPDNRETAATLRFIYDTCKIAQEWAKKQEGSTETLFKKFFEVDTNKLTVTIVPKESLLHAIDQGVQAKPFRDRFFVLPRKSWIKVTHYEKRMTWDEYLAGGVRKTTTARKMAPEQAVRDLYEKGMVKFHWGTLRLVKSYLLKLSRFLVDTHLEPEQLLKSLIGIEFHYVARKDQWLMGLKVEVEQDA
jgi:hypothetical protein